jgi:dolichol-phosphate mannosyltransferase
MTPSPLLYSVVLPIKDESANLSLLLKEIHYQLQRLQIPFEIIAVDDGSTDDSTAVLQKLKREITELKILSLDRNYGQSSAFAAGCERALGTYIITLDADGQNDPSDIPLLCMKAAEGYDMICGQRIHRADSRIKRYTSKIANFLRSRLLNDEVKDTGCSLKIFKKECFLRLPRFHGMHRFFPALFKMHGFTLTTIEVHHRKRQHGQSHYSFKNRLLGPIIDTLALMWLQKRCLRYKIRTDDRD